MKRNRVPIILAFALPTSVLVSCTTEPEAEIAPEYSQLHSVQSAFGTVQLGASEMPPAMVRPDYCPSDYPMEDCTYTDEEGMSYATLGIVIGKFLDPQTYRGAIPFGIEPDNTAEVVVAKITTHYPGLRVEHYPTERVWSAALHDPNDEFGGNLTIRYDEEGRVYELGVWLNGTH